MISYLDFKNARCKDCYKCLRECPVKAIQIVDHQAKIIEDRCILCGRCTMVCPQNAKSVHKETADVLKLLHSDDTVIASVAPSFVSSFEINDFSIMQQALKQLGFDLAEETSRAAQVVTEEYYKLLETKKYKNFITSACPAVNRLIKLYYPKALPYLAPVDTPMIAHAKMIKKDHPDAKVVFIGPCIAKKREAKESGLIDGVLTFEDLLELLEQKEIKLNKITADDSENSDRVINKAKFYPISRGIIKSFDKFIKDYEYVAVDGTQQCKEVLENIDSLSGVFLEMNSCEYACVNGPCSLIQKGTAVKANAAIRRYCNKDIENGGTSFYKPVEGIDFSHEYKRIKPSEYVPSEQEIKDILAKTGKFKPEDELNCGACGYATCREKAWAVANGYAVIEMCVPFMRERAESMSYEIIKNSPNGVVVLDNDLKIVEINNKAMALWGVTDSSIKGRDLFEYFDPTDFMTALSKNKNIYRRKVKIDRTNAYVQLNITLLQKQKVLFCIMKDITEEANYDEKLAQVKLETLTTTDDVIKKQMRVAQEIASLLGETTAETKVALLKLKKTLQNEESEK